MYALYLRSKLCALKLCSPFYWHGQWSMHIHARKCSRSSCVFQLLGKKYLAGVAV